MTFRDRRKTLIATLAMAVVVALPGIAQAGDGTDTTVAPETETTIPEHQITEVLSTLPVLGSGLNVTIARGDDGEIESVALDPDPGTIVKEGDHKVVFLLADGNTQVVVKARKHSIETKVKGDATTDVAGDGAWSADVFGTGLVTIPYTVSFDGNTPNIAIGAITAPEGVTFEVGEPKAYTDDDGEKSVFKIKVKLSTEDDRAKVSFVAKTYLDDDGELKVSLSVKATERHHRDRWDRDDDHDRDKSDRDHDDGDRDDDRRDDDDHDHDRGDDGWDD